MLTVFCLGQNPNLQTAEDVDDLLLGMSSQITKKEDNFVVEDLRGRSFHPFIGSLFFDGSPKKLQEVSFLWQS